MIFLILTSFAAAPTNDDGVLTVGGGQIDRLAWSADGEYAIGRNRATSDAVIVQIDGWKVNTLHPCAVTSVTSVPADASNDPAAQADEIYVGCDNGQIFVYSLKDELLEQQVFPGSNEFRNWQLADENGDPVSDPIPGLFWNQSVTSSSLMFFQQSGAESVIDQLDVKQGGLSSEGAYLAADQGYIDGEIDAGTLYVFHGGNKTTMVQLSTGNVTFAPNVVGSQLYSLNDITPGNQKLWGVDRDRGAILVYTPRNGTFGTPLLGLDAPTTVGHNEAADDDWIMVGGDSISVFPLSGGLITDISSPSYLLESPGYTLTDILPGSEYTLAGTEDGEIRVFSARPWIGDVALNPAAGSQGTEVSVDFSISQAASWSIHLNGDRTGSGTELASGSTSTAGESVSITFTVGENWREGNNQIYVVAAGNNLLTGHGRADFAINTLPTTPVLAEDALSFASEGLELSFVGIEDEDLSHYLIYISETPFSPEDFPTGGPVQVIADGPTLPVEVAAEPEERVSVTLRPLVLGTRYYIAVRAIDATDQESPLSNVVSGVPEPVFTAAQLAGEEGGGGCSTAPVGGWSAVMVGLLALARRSRGVLAAGLLVSGSAAASDSGKGDMSPQVGNFEIRYGPFTKVDDASITSVYGETGHEMLQLEFGPQLTRFVELDVEFGFYQELARAVSAGGDSSGTKTMLTAYPLGASGTLRLHILDEQIIVPFAKLGMDYVYFSEISDNSTGGKDKVSGVKIGHHYAIGGNLLLDVFAKGRASLLEAQTGINDTYLTFEYRRQNIDSRKTPWAGAEVSGFDLSGTMFTVGLKLDY